MTKRFLLLSLLSFGPSQCGCAVEEELGTASSEVTTSDLESQGFACIANDGSATTYRCTKDVGNDPYDSQDRYAEYRCTDAGFTCWYLGEYIPQGSYEHELNYWLEPEAGTLSGAMQRVSDPSRASKGSYLSVTGSGAAVSAFIAYDPTVVYAWARVIAPSTASDTIAIQVDNATPVQWQVPIVTTWTWLPVMTAKGRPSWQLSKGNHTLRVLGSESGVKIDRVVLATNPDFIPVAETFEAEAGSLWSPMRTGLQNIPRTTYVWVPNGAGTGGRVDLGVHAPYSGSYQVWGRTSSPSTADNAFFIKPLSLSTSPATWTTPVTSSTGWAWTKAGPTFVLRDSDIISVRQNEDGTKLDKILITNDPGFTLVETSPPPVSTL